MTDTAAADPAAIIPATGTTTETTPETIAETTTETIAAMATDMIVTIVTVTIVTATNTDGRGTSNRRVGCGQTGVSPVARHFA